MTGRLYLLLLLVSGIIISVTTFYMFTADIEFTIITGVLLGTCMLFVYRKYIVSVWILTVLYAFMVLISFGISLEQSSNSMWLKLFAVYFVYGAVILHVGGPIGSYLKSKPIKALEKIESKPEPTDLRSFENTDLPGLTVRIKSLVIDYMVVLLLFVIITVILSMFKEVPTWVRVVSFISVTILYEPLLSSTTGTIGQNIFRLKVRQFENQDEKISILNAFIRFIVKGFLGVVSFVTVHYNRDQRAIHDMAANSIVLRK